MNERARDRRAVGAEGIQGGEAGPASGNESNNAVRSWNADRVVFFTDIYFYTGYAEDINRQRISGKTHMEGYFMRNRAVLNLLYASLLLWGLIYIFASYLFFVPFLMVFLYFYPYGAVAFAVIMSFMNKKLKSEERIAAWFFLLPIILTQIVPYVQNEIKLHLTVPSDELMKDFIENDFIGGEQVLDTTFPLIHYDANNKALDVYLKIDPDRYLDYNEEISKRYKRTDEEFQLSLLRGINNKFDLMTRFHKRNLVAENITVYCYWGESLLGKTNFTRDKDEYKMVEPYPDLSLLGEDNKWYLKYDVNGKEERVFLKERQGRDFEIRWDEMGP